MTTNARLIILQYTKIKDSAVVIHTLSREWGRRSFIVHLGKNASLALFQPLGIVEAEISENPKSELWRASRVTQAVPLVSLRTDPSKNAIVLFMSEVLYRGVREGTAEEELYDWCERSILTLEALENLCAFLGFVPEEWVRRHDEETVYMIAVTPGRPIQLITEEEILITEMFQLRTLLVVLWQ